MEELKGEVYWYYLNYFMHFIDCRVFFVYICVHEFARGGGVKTLINLATIQIICYPNKAPFTLMFFVNFGMGGFNVRRS